MSRNRILFLAVMMCAVVAGSVLAATAGIAIYVDGQRVHGQAIERGGVLYLPARAVSEAFGVSVRYSASARAVLISKSGAAAAAPPPAAPRQSAYRNPAPTRESQDIVHITRTGTKYHRAGCRSLSRSDIPISRKDAITRGYTACKICNP
jgi:hypothetical protein